MEIAVLHDSGQGDEECGIAGGRIGRKTSTAGRTTRLEMIGMQPIEQRSTQAQSPWNRRWK